MEIQKIFDLVASDTSPALPVRFSGLDLSDYTSITMHVKRADTSTFSRTVTPVGVTDPELGHVTWQAGDLVPGRHEAEFEFDTTGAKATLPRKYPVILSVRSQLG